MTAWFHRFRSTRELKSALDEIGCDPGALPYFDDRRQEAALRISSVDARAANVMKQEMLSRGGDVAVHRRAIDHGVSRCGCMIFGSLRQMGYLADKLRSMPYWGLDGIRQEIINALLGAAKKRHVLALPGGRTLELGEKPALMAIINLTGDSFFSGSRASCTSECLKKAEAAMEEGADMLDLGAESTRPGSLPADLKTEKERLLPAIEAIRREFPEVPISVDTTKAPAARASVEAGADMINDISGLGFDKSMAETAADLGVPLILMHIKGVPRTMQEDPHYDCLPGEICGYFEERIDLAVKAGIKREQIILDPGIGFGKTEEHNFTLLAHGEFFRSLGLPVLMGHSRKSFLRSVPGQGDPAMRLEGTLAVTALLAWQGADIVRVHDVGPNKKVMDTVEALSRP